MVLGASARFGAWRRTVGVAAVVGGSLVATAAVAPGTSGAQASGFNGGTGSAIAQSVRIDPRAGGLSFGISVGESLAGHQNTVATAESRSVNLGVIGVTLGAPGCDGGDPTLRKENQPQPLRVDSTEDGAAEGRSEQDPKVPGVDRTVRATPDPYAESITSAQGIDIPGVLTISPTISKATSGVFGDYREATATVDIASMTLGGTVTLRGLHWEAFHRTGSREEVGGAFTIASATGPLGLPIPTDDAATAIARINEALLQVGIQIRPPAYHEDRTSNGTLATVDPFSIALVPAPLRDQITQPVLSGLQQVRDPLFQAIIDADCSSASLITILDVLLNATGPGGRLSLDLGGVQAASAAINAFQFPSLAPLPPLQPASLGVAGAAATAGSRPSTPAVAAPAASSAAAAPAAPAAQSGPVEEIADVIPGTRGGPLLYVGLGGLAALMATAEADRRKMRRAQREIPLEA
jgi:hypothetical protein